MMYAFLVVATVAANPQGEAGAAMQPVVQLAQLPVAEKQPAKRKVRLPFPLRKRPSSTYGLTFPYSWPAIPTKARTDAIFSASPDRRTDLKVRFLPDYAMGLRCGTFLCRRWMSPMADEVAHDPRPEVDRTLLAILDDPESSLTAFRFAHHLLMARNADGSTGVTFNASPLKEGVFSKLPRPAESDRLAVRAYWHVVFDESEYLPDMIPLLYNRSYYLTRNDVSGRLEVTATDIGTLFLLRCPSGAAYLLLKPLLEDEEQFAAAHILLSLRLTEACSFDADGRLFGLTAKRSDRSSSIYADPSSQDAVQAWWTGREKANPRRFKSLETWGSKTLSEWAERRAGKAAVASGKAVGELALSAEIEPAKGMVEFLPLRRRKQPEVSQRVAFPHLWPTMPTTNRAAAVRLAYPDSKVAERVADLPGDAIRYVGDFAYQAKLSKAAQAVAKDARPEVDRTLIALLDDPATSLPTFRMTHHLLLARNVDFPDDVEIAAAPLQESTVADLPRPVDDDRVGIRAYWHVVMGETEFLPDFVSLLDVSAVQIHERESGRKFVAAAQLGALLLLRTTDAEAYYLLKPLLDDEERFAVAHMLLCLKLYGVSSSDKDGTYRGLSFIEGPTEYPKWIGDPAAFETVRAWWAERVDEDLLEDAEPSAIEWAARRKVHAALME